MATIPQLKLFTSIFLFITSVAYSQQVPDVQWQKSYGGTNEDGVQSIIQTKDGGYAFVGYTASFRVDSLPQHGLNLWIVKLDTLGKIEWNKTFGGSDEDFGTSLIQTRDGGYLVTGTTYSTNGNITLQHGLCDGWIIKLDSNGEIEWQKTYGGTETDAINSAIELPGGYMVAGETNSFDGDLTGFDNIWGTPDAWVMVIDTAGKILGLMTYGGRFHDWARSIVATNDNGYIFIGTSYSKDLYGNHGSGDVWVVKLYPNSFKNIQWQSHLGGSQTDAGFTIIQSSDSGYAVVGTTYSRDGDVKGFHSTPATTRKGWIAKLDKIGHIEWQKCLGGTGDDQIHGIAQSKDGGYVLAGSAGSSDGDIIGFHAQYDIWAIKINNLGTLQWQKVFGGSQKEWGNCALSTKDDEFVVGGMNRSSDGNITETFGSEDAIVIKFAPDESSIVTLPEPFDSKLLLFARNGAVKVQYHLEKPSHVKIEVYNSIGQYLRLLKDGFDNQGDHEQEFNIYNLASGQYFLRLRKETGVEVRSFQILH